LKHNYHKEMEGFLQYKASVKQDAGHSRRKLNDLGAGNEVLSNEANVKKR